MNPATQNANHETTGLNTAPLLIRPAKKAEPGEVLISVPGRGRDVVSRAKSLFTKSVTYAVTKGFFKDPVTMDGALMEIHLTGTQEPLRLIPQFTIVSVAPEYEQVLADCLHPYASQQIAGLRMILKGIFTRYLRGRIGTGEIEKYITDKSTNSIDIVNTIARETGLWVEWELRAQPAVEEWLRILQGELASKQELQFNEGLRLFILTFTMRAESGVTSHIYRLQQRVAQGCTPQREKEALAGRISEMLTPAFDLFDGRLMWTDQAFRNALAVGFNGVVAKRLQAEFGYNVHFADFYRKPTAAELRLEADLGAKDPFYLEFLSARTAYENALSKRDEAKSQSHGNDGSSALVEREAALEKAREALRNAEFKVREQQDERAVGQMTGTACEVLKNNIKLFQARLELIATGFDSATGQSLLDGSKAQLTDGSNE